MKKLLLVLTIFILNGCSNQNESTSTKVISSQFKWDFSKKKKFIYSYSHIVNGTNKMGTSNITNKSQLSGNGYLNVSVKENNVADLSLSDIKMDITTFNKNGTPIDTNTQSAPATVIQNMKSDGSFTDSNTNVLFKILLALPINNIAVGDSEAINLKMPFRVNGSTLYSTGRNQLTFIGYEEIKNRNCAVLEGRIDISKLDIPKELKGKYASSTIGGAKYYFDLEDRCYVGADIHIIMDALMDPESKENNMFMKMKSDNIIKIRLKKVELI